MPSDNRIIRRIVGIIPMKPASQAKTRLASILDSKQRAILSMNMLDNVVGAAVESSLDEVIILGGDSEIRSVAVKWDANWRPDEGRGLNGELSAQIQVNSKSGAASVYIPADLVLLTATDVNKALESSKCGTLLTICPAVGDGGTNALVIPAHSSFQIQLGTDSFNRHKIVADRLDLPYAVVETRGFGLDLDTAEDLELLELMEPGALERMLKPGELN